MSHELLTESAQMQWEELWSQGTETSEWWHSGIAVLPNGKVVFAHPAGRSLVILDQGDGTAVQEPTTLLEIHGISIDPELPDHLWLADPGEKPRPGQYYDAPEVQPGQALCWHLGYGATTQLQQPEHDAYANGPWRPTSVVVANNGTIWVADGYGASLIHIYSPEGAFDRVITSPAMDSPSCLAMRGDQILVTELHGGLLAVDSAGNVVTLVAGSCAFRPRNSGIERGLW